MSIESSYTPPAEEKINPEKEQAVLIREVNELVPLLAHGLIKKIEQAGLRGKVSVRAVMGENWGVGVSKNNPRKDIPNIIVYPSSILTEDKSLLNARLRHEIGNLNYSINPELAELSSWAIDQDINPTLILSLAESIQEASVNYLEMQNSFADDPAESFRPLYNQEINAAQIAHNIDQSAPYKQAVDLCLLYGLSYATIIDSSLFDSALQKANPQVQELFSRSLRSTLEQALKTSVGKNKVRLIKDFIWTKLSTLIGSVDMSWATQKQSPAIETAQDWQILKEQLEKLERQNSNPEEQVEKQSVQSDLGQQLQEEQEKINQDITKAPDVEALEKAQKELENLQELVEQLTGAEQAELEDDIVYQIQEVGIDESILSPEQLDLLSRLRAFTQETSVAYRKLMRFLMQAYQEYNPHMTDEIMEKMKNRHFDTPVFTLYGGEAGSDFLAQKCAELGIDNYQTNGFLLNFNLPPILGRFWYRGGNGRLSQPVPPGAIEWGHFYRSTMPAIWNAVDRTFGRGMIFDRLNEFGQHDYRKYYYLWDINNFELPKPEDADQTNDDQENSGQSGDQVSEESQGSGQENEQEQNGENVDGQEPGQKQEEGEGSQSGESGGEGSGVGEQGQMDQEGEQGNDHLQQMIDDLKNGQQANVQAQIQQLIEELTQKLDQQALNRDDSEFGQERSSSEKGQKESDGQGGQSNEKGLDELFNQSASELLVQLNRTREQLESSFNIPNDQSMTEFGLSDEELAPSEDNSRETIDDLERIKEIQQKKLESLYKEQSGLSGEALRVYIEYMESMKDFINDLTEFFIEKFKLDQEYTNNQNQRRGARLQRGWVSKTIGVRDEAAIVDPRVFEKRSIPKKPQFIWSIIIDNTGSVGYMIEEEKKLAIALIEVTKALNIPFEIVVYREGGYAFLKTFDTEAYGDNLSKVVLLQANIGNQEDTMLLRATHQSQETFVNQFNRSSNFIFFLTDGLACSSDSLSALIQQYKRDTVVMGVGLAQGANTIGEEFGQNSLAVPEIKDLSKKFFKKLEDIISRTFD